MEQSDGQSYDSGGNQEVCHLCEGQQFTSIQYIILLAMYKQHKWAITEVTTLQPELFASRYWEGCANYISGAAMSEN